MMVKDKKKLWICLAIAGAAAALLLTGLLLILKRPAEAVPTVPTQTTQAAETAPGEFAYRGAYLTSLTRECALGIDVSTHQGEIQWEQVKAAGIEFVMLRLGYRGTDLGGIYADERLEEYYAGAKAAGLQVGAYFFSQAISEAEALEEAELALQLMQDKQLDMPLVYDWEDTGPESRVAQVDGETVTRCAQVFCQAVEAAGFTPMVYFNPDLARSRLQLESLTDYGFWLAYYDEEIPPEYTVDMWQYTSCGHVPGIEGDVDINLYFPE